MHFEKIFHKDYIARLVFENDAQSILINEELAIKFLNHDFKITERTMKKHVYNSETDEYDKIEDKTCWFQLFELDNISGKRYVSRKEIDRIEQSQKSLARILDEHLYAYFDGGVKHFNKIRSDFRYHQKVAGIGELQRQYGENWKEQYEKALNSKRYFKFLRDTLCHVNRDFITKVQEMQKNKKPVPKTKFTIFNSITYKQINWVSLSIKQHVRTNKPVWVNMPILIDDDFLNAITV